MRHGIITETRTIQEKRRRTGDKVKTKRFDSARRLMELFYVRHNTVGIFQSRPFAKFNVIKKSSFWEKGRIAEGQRYLV